MNTMASDLEPLRARMAGRTGQLLRPISRVSFSLTDTQAFEKAIDQSLAWVGPKAGIPLPTEARERRGFNLSSPDGRHSCNAMRLDSHDGSIWAIRVDEPGSDPTAGEVWSTELFVEQRVGDLVRFGAQLSSRRPVNASAVAPNRPRLVHEIVTRLSAEADGVAITEQIAIFGPANAVNVAKLLYRPNRRLPVVAVSIDEPGGAQVDLGRLARRLSGAVHLVALDIDAGWELTKLIGKRLSTYNGAVRIYMPGLTDEDEDPFAHPLWLPRWYGTNPALIDQIAAQVFPQAFRGGEGDARFWHIAQLRQAASSAAVATTSGSEVELLRAELQAANDRTLALEGDLESAEALLEDAGIRVKTADVEQARLRQEIDELKTRNFVLSTRPSAAGDQTAGENTDAPLTSYYELGDWAAQTLGPNIFIHGKALKDCRENGHPDMLSKIERTLLVIRDFWIPAKMNGGLDRQESLTSALTSLGVSDEPCFRQYEKAKREDGYSVADGGVTRVLYDHFKYGTSRNNAEQFRIYYSWDDDTKRLIIGKMPTHLPTAIS